MSNTDNTLAEASDILKWYAAEFPEGNEDIENDEALYNKSDVLKAMEEYATAKIHQLQQEYEALQRWKEEAKALLNPIFEYAQDHPDMKIGGSMTEFVLERCKKYDKLKQHYGEVYTMLMNIDELTNNQNENNG